MANIPGLEKWNFSLLMQIFQLWTCTSAALNTSPLCRYNTCTSLLIREALGQKQGINEGCNSLIYWVLWRCSLKSLLDRYWRHPFGPGSFNITDSYRYALIFPLKHFYTLVIGAPKNCFQLGFALVNTGPDQDEGKSFLRGTD